MSTSPQAQPPTDNRMERIQSRIGKIQGRIDEDPNTANQGLTRRVGNLQERYDKLSARNTPEDLAIPPPGNPRYLGPPNGGFPGVVNRQGGGPGTTIANPFRSNQGPIGSGDGTK